MKRHTVFFMVLCLPALAFGQTPDTYQADIAPELVAKVNDAKEKQVSGKNLDSAEAELNDVLRARPDYYRALFNLGLIYQSQGKGPQAIETLERALQARDKLKISDVSILNSLGWVYLNSGNLDKAESIFLEALKTESTNKPASNQLILNNLGYLYLQKGDAVTARAYLDKSIKEYDNSGAKKIEKLVDDYEQRQKDAPKARQVH